MSRICPNEKKPTFYPSNADDVIHGSSGLFTVLYSAKRKSIIPKRASKGLMIATKRTDDYDGLFDSVTMEQQYLVTLHEDTMVPLNSRPVS